MMEHTESMYSSAMLTEQEKYQCVVRHLNELYIKYYNGEEHVVSICDDCPLAEKCTIPGSDRKIMPTVNFEVLEQFTGKGTVINDLLDNRGILGDGWRHFNYPMVRNLRKKQEL